MSRPATSFSAWWLAARPATLSASAAPVLVGISLAWAAGQFVAGPALAALLGALLLQIGANFANDVYDYERGADTAERLGPARATQQGWISAARMKRAMLAAFAAALGIGVYLTAVAGWPVLALGLSALAAAWLYTGGPRPYGYVGLGDPAVFVYFGLAAVAGTYYVQALSLSLLVWLAAIPMGALATAILVVNNLRDIDTDAKAAKHTLAVRMGDAWTRRYYLALLLLAYAMPLLMIGWAGATWWVLLSWLSLPFAVALARRVRVERGLALNPCLAHTAKLEFGYAVLLALGLSL